MRLNTDRVVSLSAMIVGLGSLFIIVYQTALLREQHPDLAELPHGTSVWGWDNVNIPLGRELIARLPRRALSAPAEIRNAVRQVQAAGSRTAAPRFRTWANASATASLAISASPANA